MAKKYVEYNELSRAKISSKRVAVISACSKGGFTIAQQIETSEEDKVGFVFLKGALHVEDVDGLYALRDAINVAISRNEDGEEEGEWEE